MIRSRNKQTGVSLVEVLLVLAIGAAILFASIKQYQIFRSGADVEQVKYNVDTIFHAMSQFYSVNCNGTTAVRNGTYTFTPGMLNPTYSPAPANPFPVNITTLLQQNGYLTQVIPINPIVNSSGPATNSYNGYVAQFNQSQVVQTRSVCVTGVNATGITAATGCTQAKQVGTAIIWKAQVAVLIKNTAAAQQYLNLLSGDCLSSLNGTTVRPCSANQPGNYVVWERLPSFATPNAQSDSWETYPALNQFNQLYSTYPTVYLSGMQGKIPNNQTQYFLCGG